MHGNFGWRTNKSVVKMNICVLMCGRIIAELAVSKRGKQVSYMRLQHWLKSVSSVKTRDSGFTKLSAGEVTPLGIIVAGNAQYGNTQK